MRPIVKAVGLICILAHDHSIVKMKMLFGYPVAIIDHKLSVDFAPVLTATCPLFRDVLHSKIQHFEKAIVSRKYGLCLSHFLKLSVKALYGIGRIDQLPKLLRKLEISAEIGPVPTPGFGNLRIFLIPFFGKILQGIQGALFVNSGVNSFQISHECLNVLV